MDMDVINKSLDVLTHYPGPVLIATSIICSGVMAWTVLRWKEHQDKKNADGDMKRRAMLDQRYADKFGDILLDMYANDEITKHEYRRDCRRFGLAFRLSDLLVKKNKRRGLRYVVRHNCADMHHTPDLRGKLPGERPDQNPRNNVPVVVVVPTKRKVWVVPGKFKERTT